MTNNSETRTREVSQNPMKSSDIRSAFLQYFERNQHRIVASSSLVPGNDPTLLFTNAGMVQFKDVFLGAESQPYNRAVTSQRCVRAGGKHNDLENVGYTARHHTFFEMLGNFSFGDYFKRDAIGFAWEFLTEVLQLPKDKLWVTVHLSDDEAADIWINEIGVPATRFSRLDEDNFWQMGDTGPCGPCSEIFYDHGPDIWGGPPGSPEEDGDRYIEIWNLVFMQYERQADGELIPLPNPSIDTGMGLERIAAVKQGVHNNYEIDLFQKLLQAASALVGERDLSNQSLRVIADHIRSCAFLVVDGVLPSNEGRGYVLRRIIRRALRHASKLGCSEPFFHKLVPALVDEMGTAYPELTAAQEQVVRVLLVEEEQFAKTLDKGMAVLEGAVAELKGNELPGDLIFKLHDTFGFPTDLTNDIARERNLGLDMDGFERCMTEQRRKSQDASKFDLGGSLQLDQEGTTDFTGYEGLSSHGTVTMILVDGKPVERLEANQDAVVVLDRTAFYAESGGQVGDVGALVAEQMSFDVQDCQKQAGQHLHRGQLVRGVLSPGDSVDSRVDENIRQATVLNHSATHLLHAGLREVLGDQVTQQGSLVNSERLRFDFSHFQAVTSDELKAIERRVNAEIRRNTPVDVETMSMVKAKEKGAMALFSEKYGDEVRVLSMGGGFSVELCGGTHVARTGDIGMLKILSESGVASGVRRIEAITGAAAERYIDELEQRLADTAEELKASPQALVDKARQLQRQARDQEREIEQLQMKLANSSGSDLSAQAVDINGVKLLAAKLDNMDPKNLRTMVDQLKSKLGSAVVLLGTSNDGKVALVCGVTKDLVGRVHAGKILAEVAAQVGGKGGGRPDMAQGGGNAPEHLDSALASAETLLNNLTA